MFELWRVRRKLKIYSGARDRDYAKQKASLQTEKDFGAWVTDWEPDIMLLETDYLLARTSHWRRRAMASLVELPPRSKEDVAGQGYWERTDFSRLWLLTDKGVAYTRKAGAGGATGKFRDVV